MGDFVTIAPIDATYRILTVDTILPNGATVLACNKTGERVPNDTYASWLALCARQYDNTPHPYVIWTVVARPNGFEAYHGHYCRTYDEAEAKYQELGGR
jgi:hypothetical protein